MKRKTNIIKEEAIHFFKGFLLAFSTAPALAVIIVVLFITMNDQNTIMISNYDPGEVWVRLMLILFCIEPDLDFELWFVTFLLLFYPYLFMLMLRLGGYAIKSIANRLNKQRG